jgi:hypothetical protein
MIRAAVPILATVDLAVHVLEWLNGYVIICGDAHSQCGSELGLLKCVLGVLQLSMVNAT